MMSLKLLASDPSDWGSQRCRMGPGMMTDLGLSLGSPVLLSVPGGSCLCTAWPRSDLAEGYLHMDQLCVSPALISRPPRLPLTLHPQHLTPLTCSKLKVVRITVVVQTAEFRKNTPSRIVHELVKDMLKGLVVCNKYVVDLGGFGTEIRYIVVDSIHMDAPTAGIITSKTSVEIACIQTNRHYRRQLKGQDTAPLGGLEEVRDKCLLIKTTDFDFILNNGNNLFLKWCFQVNATLKEMLQLPLLYSGTLTSLGVSCPRGVLLVGPPGVGKTQLVRRVVGQVGASLVVVRGPEVQHCHTYSIVSIMSAVLLWQDVIIWR